jgi:hypothetical protein
MNRAKVGFAAIAFLGSMILGIHTYSTYQNRVKTIDYIERNHLWAVADIGRLKQNDKREYEELLLLGPETTLNYALNKKLSSYALSHVSMSKDAGGLRQAANLRNSIVKACDQYAADFRLHKDDKAKCHTVRNAKLSEAWIAIFQHDLSQNFSLVLGENDEVSVVSKQRYQMQACNFAPYKVDLVALVRYFDDDDQKQLEPLIAKTLPAGACVDVVDRPYLYEPEIFTSGRAADDIVVQQLRKTQSYVDFWGTNRPHWDGNSLTLCNPKFKYADCDETASELSASSKIKMQRQELSADGFFLYTAFID